MDKLPVIILGAGGHAKVLIDSLRGFEILGTVTATGTAEPLLGVICLGDEASLFEKFKPETVILVNGVGTVGDPKTRISVFDRFKTRSYRFLNIIHPSAIIGQQVQLGEGIQILAGAIIQPGCKIGDNTIINTRATIDHDCDIGKHVHVAPGSTLSGNVTLGNNSHVGTGACIIQSIKIGENALVAAGAAVIHDVSNDQKVGGVPARPI